MNMIPNRGGENKNSTPRYATLLYHVLKELDISINEYFYLDMVHKLSYHRWCTKSLENCANDMNISKRGVIKLRDRLISRGYLKKNIKGHLKVTELYTDVAVNKVTQPYKPSVNKVPKLVNKVHPIGELSDTKNNNRITRDKEAYKKENGSGYAQAKAMRQKLSAVMSTS